MKIQKIEYENFRNFRERGEIRCSTDGKVTIIYGKNGDGKTTLHQLLQWVFYGEVHFNKTANDHLYNLGMEKECAYGDSFQVMGRIDFEHEGKKYSLTRTAFYKKDILDSKRVSEDVSLNYCNENNDWERVESPSEIIEKMLPSGLSDYFFFDGESMIADLRVKGRDSASKLKRALYSMFDLDVLENALNHIGETNLKTTALGKLYLSKGVVSNDSTTSKVKTEIENAQSRINNLKDELEEKKNEKKKNQQLIQDISEQIGNTKTTEEYEKQRQEYIRMRDSFLNNFSGDLEEFGKALIDMFPMIFISKAVKDAKGKIRLKIADEKLPHGLRKELIEYLLEESTEECICGTPLGTAEKQRIKDYYRLLPPKSYANLYDEFSRTTERWATGYSRDLIEGKIRIALENKRNAGEYDKKIKELDDELKEKKDYEDLVITRKNAENTVEDLDDRISAVSTEIKKFELYLKKKMDEFDSLTATVSANKRIQRQIDILARVAEYFSSRLKEESDNYSRLLEGNIQILLDQMLTSKRRVSVSPEFSVTITDSYDDESKSEGQFAVVSFAYIGGILKMLKSEESLSTKEYPLVLDGPFSKLDPDQRQNVVDTIPSFAPQVILFSKDDLQNVFSADSIGHVWTIKSNEEKNEAIVKEGFLWK